MSLGALKNQHSKRVVGLQLYQLLSLSGPSIITVHYCQKSEKKKKMPGKMTVKTWLETGNLNNFITHFLFLAFKQFIAPQHFFTLPHIILCIGVGVWCEPGCESSAERIQPNLNQSFFPILIQGREV